MFWLAAVVAGIVPSRFWPALERELPMRSAAAASGTATLLAGFFYGFGGFMTFATALAGANNDWMLARLAGPPAAGDAAAGLVPYGVSVLTLFLYLFFTPRGLFSTYVVASGALRAVSGYFDDPLGDPLLTGLDRAVLDDVREEPTGAAAARARTARGRRRARRPADRRMGGSARRGLRRAGGANEGGVERGTIVMTSGDW